MNDPWLTSYLSQRTSEPAYYIVEWRILNLCSFEIQKKRKKRQVIARKLLLVQSGWFFRKFAVFRFSQTKKNLAAVKITQTLNLGHNSYFFFTQLKTVSQNMLLIGCFQKLRSAQNCVLLISSLVNMPFLIIICTWFLQFSSLKYLIWWHLIY